MDSDPAMRSPSKFLHSELDPNTSCEFGYLLDEIGCALCRSVEEPRLQRFPGGTLSLQLIPGLVKEIKPSPHERPQGSPETPAIFGALQISANHHLDRGPIDPVWRQRRWL